MEIVSWEHHLKIVTLTHEVKYRVHSIKLAKMEHLLKNKVKQVEPTQVLIGWLWHLPVQICRWHHGMANIHLALKVIS